VVISILIAVAAACGSPTSSQAGESQAALLYDITYFGNGNTAGDVPLDGNKYEYGQDLVTIRGRGNLYRLGYHFAGWNTQADGLGKQYDENINITMGSSPIALYANWTEVYPRISAGDNFSTLLTQDGVLYSAGNNANGRLGDGGTSSHTEFTQVKISATVQTLSSGTDHSIAILRDGSVAVWGRGDYGKLGLDQDDISISSIPKTPYYSGTTGKITMGEAAHVIAGRYQTAVLTKNGEYWAAGSKNVGALGIEQLAGSPNRERMLKYVTSEVKSLAAAQYSIMLVKNDGSLWIAGEGSYGKLGSGNEVNVPKLRRNGAVDHSNVKVFAGKRSYYMVLKNDGRIMGAGQNNYGQLGNGNTQNQTLFGEVIDFDGSEMTDVAHASLGDTHSMILRQDGTLWAMGKNSDNQLGTNLSGNQTRAIMVLDNVAYVAAGYNHTLAVREDGSLWAAGSNASGQFGGKITQTVDALPNSAWVNIDISKFIHQN
jgi:uncharacterized repeat protein (TIGR02543 family)